MVEILPKNIHFKQVLSKLLKKYWNVFLVFTLRINSFPKLLSLAARLEDVVSLRAVFHLVWQNSGANFGQQIMKAESGMQKASWAVYHRDQDAHVMNRNHLGQFSAPFT